MSEDDIKVYCKTCGWKGRVGVLGHYILGSCCPVCKSIDIYKQKLREPKASKEPFSAEKRSRKTENCKHDYYEDVDDYNNKIRICKKCHEGQITEWADGRKVNFKIEAGK